MSLAPTDRATPALSVHDEALHPLLRYVLDLPSLSSKDPTVALAAFRVPFKALRFLLARPALWPYVVMPALISIVLFAVLLWGLWAPSHGWLDYLWTKPVVEQWFHYLWLGLWYLAFALVKLVVVAVAYGTTLILGSVLASPFNDVLSEKTEQELLGERYVKPADQPFLPDLIRSIISSLTMALITAAVLIPLLFLNLIPVVGSVAYTVIGAVCSSFFLTAEYTDTLLVRKGFTLRTKLSEIRKHRRMTLGFGIGVNLMLAIPLLNFLCIPIAVIAGTAMGLGFEQWARYGKGVGEAPAQGA